MNESSDYVAWSNLMPKRPEQNSSVRIAEPPLVTEIAPPRPATMRQQSLTRACR
jgi:hypothetical protein